MPYRVGNKGSYGCSGYPALKDDGTVMGCHKTRKAAMGQIYAINRSEGNIGKAMLKEGDFAMIGHKDEALVGQVVHVMTDGMLGVEGSDKAIMASPDNPAILIRLFEQEDSGYWEETSYFYGHSAAMFVAIDPLQTEPSMDAEVSKGESELFSARDVTKTQRLTEIFKRDYSMAERRRMAASGAAMPDGSYPIADEEDLRNAIQAFGRTDNPRATKEHIMRRARSLNLESLIPENWK